MTTGTTTPIDQLRRIERTTDAAAVAHGTYRQLLELLDQLAPADWAVPTECDGWDVADMVGHLIGAAKAGASLRETARQQLVGMRRAADHDGNALDACNALQVRDHAGLGPAARIAELRRVAPRAVRGRMRLPRPLRAVSVRLSPAGSTAPGTPDRLRLAELMDVVYSRDVWLHTVDIARATGRARPPAPHVDRRIVEDVVADWSGRHGQPFVLELTGAVAGRYRAGEDGPRFAIDAVEFCRILSGRAEPDALDDGVPPAATALLGARMVF
ncbi:MAG TPA: maleylpyruvate isomerase family mycothiol-dependent enzyme [Egicoccus sp.]|nr:maleylpyruvate isomerase family mycothiol-dependent enzyme [Egicoccus sp.]HSK24456.1 maleylpyruvate isomerase family mycothiol-dependent enzyme [Egicoccus sp.]